MYEVPREDVRPGCRDVWVLTLAVFAVILPVVVALIVVLVGLTAALYLFAVHPALALLPIAGLAAGAYGFALWERRRFRPPGF